MEQFLEILAQKILVKKIENLRRMFLAYLQLKKTCHLALGLSICKLPANSVQNEKKVLASHKEVK